MDFMRAHVRLELHHLIGDTVSMVLQLIVINTVHLSFGSVVIHLHEAAVRVHAKVQLLH